MNPVEKQDTLQTCKYCGSKFDTVQKLGTHVYSKHPESHRTRTTTRQKATRRFAVEVVVRTHASPSYESRMTIPCRSVVEMQELYHAMVTRVSAP